MSCGLRGHLQTLAEHVERATHEVKRKWPCGSALRAPFSCEATMLDVMWWVGVVEGVDDGVGKMNVCECELAVHACSTLLQQRTLARQKNARVERAVAELPMRAREQCVPPPH